MRWIYTPISDDASQGLIALSVRLDCDARELLGRLLERAIGDASIETSLRPPEIPNRRHRLIAGARGAQTQSTKKEHLGPSKACHGKRTEALESLESLDGS